MITYLTISPLWGNCLKSQSFACRGISRLSPFNSYKIFPVPELPSASRDELGSDSTFPKLSWWMIAENWTDPGDKILILVAINFPCWFGSSATVNSQSSFSLTVIITIIYYFLNLFVKTKTRWKHFWWLIQVMKPVR